MIIVKHKSFQIAFQTRTSYLRLPFDRISGDETRFTRLARVADVRRFISPLSRHSQTNVLVLGDTSLRTFTCTAVCVRACEHHERPVIVLRAFPGSFMRLESVVGGSNRRDASNIDHAKVIKKKSYRYFCICESGESSDSRKLSNVHICIILSWKLRE